MTCEMNKFFGLDNPSGRRAIKREKNILRLESLSRRLSLMADADHNMTRRAELIQDEDAVRWALSEIRGAN